MTTLLAFHGLAETKLKYENRVREHVKLDNLVKGATGNGGKGCAVWCTLNKYDHKSYESELGIPMVLARLEDRIFEGSSLEYSQTWPSRFLAAVPVGADLSNVWRQFFRWLLIDPEHGVIKYASKYPRSEAAIMAVGKAFENFDTTRVQWLALRDECWAARKAAANANAAAAYAAAAAADAAAADAAAADAAANAAANDAAADAAANAAANDAAATAADAAAYAAAYAAYAAYYAAADAYARSKAFEIQGDKLLELMAAAPVTERAA